MGGKGTARRGMGRIKKWTSSYIAGREWVGKPRTADAVGVDADLTDAGRRVSFTRKGFDIKDDSAHFL